MSLQKHLWGKNSVRQNRGTLLDLRELVRAPMCSCIFALFSGHMGMGRELRPVPLQEVNTHFAEELWELSIYQGR